MTPYNLTDRIVRAMVASCNCMTKTNDPLIHDTDCRYKVLSECLVIVDTAYKMARAFTANCPSCGMAPFTWDFKRQTFPYGLDGEGQVTLEAHVPVGQCDKCGFEFTDRMAEVMREEAVNAYLSSLVKKGNPNG